MASLEKVREQLGPALLRELQKAFAGFFGRDQEKIVSATDLENVLAQVSETVTKEFNLAKSPRTDQIFNDLRVALAKLLGGKHDAVLQRDAVEGALRTISAQAESTARQELAPGHGHSFAAERFNVLTEEDLAPAKQLVKFNAPIRTCVVEGMELAEAAKKIATERKIEFGEALGIARADIAAHKG